ncbi:MAG: VWA domain-containing protein [Candidatus Limnocylindria bacterium]
MSQLVGLVRPEALPLLAVVGLLALVGLWAEIRRRRALTSFAGRGSDLASVSEARRRLKLVLVLAALAAAVIGLAGPFVDVVEREVVQSGVDLVVALDVSQSMAVRDVEPDRLRAAKDFIHRLGDELTQSRVALVLFAGEGIVRYPPTADPSVLGEALDSIGGGFKPEQGGSSLAAAVEAALGAFPPEARESERSKAIVLVSDGEDLTGQVPSVEELRASNTLVFAVGVGTAAGGPVPSYDNVGRFHEYLRHQDRRQIVSRLDEDALRALAEGAGGGYLRLEPGPGTVNSLVTELRRLDASELGGAEGTPIPDDRYQLFLALAVAALIVEELISDRRRMPRPRSLRAPRVRPRFRIPRPALGRAHGLVLLAASALALSSCAEMSASEADQMYLAGDHRGALARYRQLAGQEPGVVELRVNAGNALHRLGELDPALAEYAYAVREGSAAVAAVAHYQTGNTLFRKGELEEAREAYKDALRLDPGDRDAKFNIEIIDRMLAERAGELQQQGRSNPNAPGNQGGEPNEQQQGSPLPGASGPPGAGEDPQPGGGGEEAEQGTPGPQGEGPPETSSGQAAPSLSDVLQRFRSDLTVDQALRLLDALLAEQRGIEVLIEGVELPRGGADPTY